ncbi:MAG: choice-of-anchor F family protein [Marinobacter adhaerens]
MQSSLTCKRGRSGSTRTCSVVRSPIAALAGFVLSGAMAGNALAQEPTPNTYTDVPVPQLTGWNEVNYLNVEPGIDGYSGASARTHVYSSELAKQAAADELAKLADEDPNNDPDDIEDDLWAGSPAAVYYALDDGSGRAPGIQVVTDDLEFPTNNCIMSSGERIDEELGTLVPKTCSDPQGSAKRYFLEIREADTPVDLVFDTGMKDIRYKGVRDPAEDGGEELAAFKEEYGIGRIYRVIQKVVNNSDERWLGIRMELGHGVGNSFVPFNASEDGVAFELRESVPREFFEGETGAPDIPVWNPDRFATFSPKAFDDGSRERFDPGFFDAQAAGHFPPQNVGNGSDKTTLIFSGDDYNDIGSYGAITDNHFSMADTQAMGAYDVQGVFGYMMADALAPYVIARYDEGEPDGESSALEAWWDGSDWRYGQAGDETGANPFGVIPVNQLEQWATKLLGIDPGQLDDSVRYSSDLADDLATQNMDTFIYISDAILNESGEPKYDNITLRVTGVSTASAGLSETSLGNEIPAWITPEDGEFGTVYVNNAPPLSSYVVSDAPVALNDSATTYERVESTNSNYDPDAFPLNLPILANDVFNGKLFTSEDVDGNTIVNPDVTINSFEVNGAVVYDASNPANQVASVDVLEEGQPIGTVQLNDEGVIPSVDFTPDIGYTGQATFTYSVNATFDDGTDAIGPATSREATVSIQVDAYPDPEVPVAVSDSATTFMNTPVTIDVLSNDRYVQSGTPTVSMVDLPLTGDAVVENGNVVYTPAANFVGLDRFTYNLEVDGKTSTAGVITVRVDEPVAEDPAETDSGEGSGPILGCSYNPGAPFDPTLPLAALAAIGGLVVRNRRKQTMH